LKHIQFDQIEDSLEISYQLNNVCLEFYKNSKIPVLSKILCNKVKIFDFVKEDYMKTQDEIEYRKNL